MDETFKLDQSLRDRMQRGDPQQNGEGEDQQMGENGQQPQQGQQGQQPGQGQEGMAGQGGQNGRDPLGRPRSTTSPDFGDQAKVPDEIDVQRAREILEAICEKLRNNPPGEIERRYLERLLDIQ